MRIKGVMFDMARVTERHSYYSRMLPLVAEWGYNTIFLHFTDDQGCAMEFECMPEIASPHAYSQREMRRFVKEAGRYGLEVVPEVESFGHTEYITRLPRYRHLYEIVPGKHAYSAICPTNEETLAILRKLYSEVAEIFPTQLLHVGLDEVSFGTCGECRQMLKSKERWEMFADHVVNLRAIAADVGKQIIIWGDHLVAEKRIAARLPKDIIVCHWYYRPDVSSDALELLTGKGFQVICAPALVGMNQTVLPGPGNLANVRNFSRLAWEYADKGVIGLLNTVWEPFRYPQGSINYGIALAGHLFSNRGRESRQFGRRFLAGYFGVDDNTRMLGAILRLHEIAPGWLFMKKATFRVFKEISVIADDEVAEAQRVAELATAVGAVLKEERCKVVRQLAEYDDFILAADMIRILGDRLAALQSVMKTYRSARSAYRRGRYARARELARGIEPVLCGLAGDGRELYSRAKKRWNVTRYADDPKRDNIMLVPWGFDDCVTARLRVSAGLLAKLRDNARTFARRQVATKK